MKALVLGAGGQLGTELVRLLGPESAVTHSELDITDEGAVEAMIASRRPEVVFNCAAYNTVDLAENQRELANAVNGDAPGFIAASCGRHDAMLIHFSTNFVFDGRQKRPYVESDEASPGSVYAWSKLRGERLALEKRGRILVVRTAAVFGGARSNFPERVLERVARRELLSVVSDQRVNPTYAKDLAEAARDLAEKGMTGIVHAVSEGCVAWDEFAREVVSALDLEAEVRSVTSAEFGSPAGRPANGCLATVRYRPLPHWRDAVQRWAARRKNP